jgi:phage terminase large subunit-like protein
MIGARIRLPVPHTGQRIILSEARRFNWLSAGRRWRKTTLSLHTITSGALRGGRYIWGAPTYDQTRIGMDELRHAWGDVADFNLSRMTATMPGGGLVYFRSLDKSDNVRGYTADGVVIDEAGFVKGDVWHEVLRPMLMDTGGWLWAKGTPNGRNWFWREWMAAQAAEDAAAWQVPTLGVEIRGGELVRKPHPLENPNIDFEEMKNLFSNTPERIFQQEYLAQFIDDAGGVFRRVMECATAETINEPQRGRQYVAGVDVASLVDYTVVTVFDVAAREVVFTDRFNRVDYNVLENRLTAVYHRFGLSSMTVEANSIGQPVIDHLRQKGLTVIPFTTTNSTKQAIIQGLQSAFEHGSIKIPNDPIMIDELQSFEAKRNASGSFSYSAPDGMHDDMVMSLAIAWDSISKSGPVVLW